MNRIRVEKRIKELIAFLMVLVLILPKSALAAEQTVDLGTTSTFAILAGSTITNTATIGDKTIISGDVSGGGDVGLYPGSAFIGQTEATISGTVHLADTVAEQAQEDLVLAYDDAKSRYPSGGTLAGDDNQLGGKVLKSGVYVLNAASTANLAAGSTLTLDAEGDPNAVFIFQCSSSLLIGSSSHILLVNEARYCRVFWQVTSSATIGTGAEFVGHILALASITVNTDATVQGQLLARDGAVTLQFNNIMNGLCANTTPPPTQTPSPTNTPTPSPTSTPSSVLTNTPTPSPTNTPSSVLTNTPSSVSTNAPSSVSTNTPNSVSTNAPSSIPTNMPSSSSITPMTGDTATPWLWAGVSVATLTGIIVLIVRRKRVQKRS